MFCNQGLCSRVVAPFGQTTLWVATAWNSARLAHYGAVLFMSFSLEPKCWTQPKKHLAISKQPSPLRIVSPIFDACVREARGTSAAR
jgi:hypothetical protein